MQYKSLMLATLISFPAMAQLQSMGLEDMDAILSKTGEFTSQSYHQSISIDADFNVGTSNGKLSDCSNQKPRRKTSFYPCWNGQSKDFLSKLAFTMRHQKEDIIHSQFTFNLNKNGALEDIKIKGVKDLATRQQLIQLLKKMEFGYSRASNTQTISLNITTQQAHK